MSLNIGILDYGAGNLRSVINAFATVGHEAALVTEPQHFDSLDVLIFPGQGAFGDSVRQLQNSGLWTPLKQWLAEGKPYFGICLGYQLLFESSEENPGVEGLGLYRGKVRRFERQPGVKIPHMGWNSVVFRDPAHPAWRGLGDEAAFYFVHSFYPEPEDDGIVACKTDYAGNFASGAGGRNLLAVQFHPEKSQRAGLQLLANAVDFLRQGSQSVAGPGLN